MTPMLPLARALLLLSQIGQLPSAPIVIVHQPGVGNAIPRNAFTDRRTIWINDAGPEFTERAPDAITLAGILAHEQFHVDHGPNECAAYLAQLATLARLGVDAKTRARVTRTMDRFCKAGE